MGYLEETEAVDTGATEQLDSQTTPETLEGQELGTEKPVQAEGTEQVETEKTAEEVQAEAGQPNFNPDEEIEIELNGKKYVMKQGEVMNLLEKNQGLSEKEQQLSQKEKQLMRDYTQKTQEVAGIRKSFEANFGVMPDPEELKALGKVYKEYGRNPAAKAAIDQILSGGIVPTTATEKGAANPQLNQALQEIANLKEQLEGFTSSIQERESQQEMAANKSVWEKWEAEKAKSGIKITQEIDTAMTPWVKAIRNAQPDWDKARVLEEAYAMATRGQTEQKAVKKVLLSVDEAKKRGVLKITPKTPAKSVKDQSYAEIVSE